MNKPYIRHILAFITIVITASNMAYSQKDARSLENLSLEDLLNMKVTTASKTLQNIGEAPATVIAVTAEQIKTRGYRNLAQVLNDLPDFKVHDKSDPQMYNPISSRGIFRQDYFVILLDGVRISSPTNEPLPLLENFPIYFARQIEVVYGPGSALYGADAMAGVINIITEKHEEDKLTVSSVLGTQGYNNNTLYLNKQLKNGLNVVAAGQYSYDAQPDFSKVHKEAYDMTSHQTGLFNSAYGPMKPSRPVDPDYEAPVKAYNYYAALNKGGFSFNLLSHYSQTPSSTTLKPDNGIYNKAVFYGQGVTTASMNYADSIGKVKSITSFMTSLYKVNPKSNYSNIYGSMNRGYKYSTGSMVKLEEQLTYEAGEKVQIVGGLTYELFHSLAKTPELQYPVSKRNALMGVLLNSPNVNNPEGIKADLYPILYTNIGSYAQVRYTVIKQLSITGGLRFDNNSRFGTTFNPRVGAIFNTGKTTIKALYGTAYWAPSPAVTFESYGSFNTADSGRTYQSDFWHLPNPELKPVTSRTTELTITQKINDKLRISATGYYTRMNNMITSVSDNGNTNLYNNRFAGSYVAYIAVPFNLGSQVNFGGNITVNSVFNLGDWQFNAYSSISYVDGEVEEVRTGNKMVKTELPLIAPWQFRLGVDGKLSGFYFSARLQLTGKQRLTGFTNPTDTYERKTIDGYALLNASAGYTVKNRITFFATVQNALDQKYFNPVSGGSEDTNAPAFTASYQDPIRIIGGVRLNVF